MEINAVCKGLPCASRGQMELVPRQGIQGQRELSTMGASLGSVEVLGLRRPFLRKLPAIPQTYQRGIAEARH